MISFVLIAALSVSAQRAPRRSPERQTARTEKDERKEQMRQEATASFPQLEEVLETILKKTNLNQRPAQETVEKGVELIEENKRNGWAYDDQQKAQFMLLQAWTGFYQDNMLDAVRWSMRACKTRQESQDAWNSQILFSLLTGKRPLLPRLDKPKPRPRRPSNGRRRRDDEEVSMDSSTPKPYSEKGLLTFDLEGLKSEMLKEQFGRLEFQAVNGAEIQYQPGADTMCILFWQDQELMDPNDLSQNERSRNKKQLPEPTDFEMDMAYDRPAATIQTQRDYLRFLKDACQENPKIKFLQLNTNHPGSAANVLEKMIQDADIEKAGPLVFAAMPDSKAQRFVGIQAEKPFLTIIDTEGKVVYAGTAQGFAPAFILSELTNVEIDLALQSKTGQSGQAGLDAMDFDMMMEMEMLGGAHAPAPKQPAPNKARDPNAPIADPNVPIADPNAPIADPNLPAKASGQSPGLVTLSLEDQVRAEKLLQSAEMHIENSRKLTIDNPRQGIEDARKVIEKYPNTKEAEKARYLLSRVPPSWKKKHKITEEEISVKKESE